jgi:hypothetical protein
MHNVTTVSVATNNVRIYYDHWENGYTNGASGDEVFAANRGDVMTFESTNILVPRTTAFSCTSANSRSGGATGVAPTNCYDGRDRIYVVGGAVSVAQTFWPEALGTVYANAWEIYPVKPEQTSYIIPVGEDLNTGLGYTDFTNVYVLVEATADSTSIQIDDPIIAGDHYAQSRRCHRVIQRPYWHNRYLHQAGSGAVHRWAT